MDIIEQLDTAKEMVIKSSNLPISGVLQRAIDEIKVLRKSVKFSEWQSDMKAADEAGAFR